jgi:hypothetical protein
MGNQPVLPGRDESHQGRFSLQLKASSSVCPLMCITETRECQRSQLSELQPGCSRVGSNEVRARLECPIGLNHRPKAPPQSIPRHCVAAPLVNCVGDEWTRQGFSGVSRVKTDPDRPSSCSALRSSQVVEVLATANTSDRLAGQLTYALIRWRPLRRRDFSTARPALVDIRARKPCFLARRRVLGWKVRFTCSAFHCGRWGRRMGPSTHGECGVERSPSTRLTYVRPNFPTPLAGLANRV